MIKKILRYVGRVLLVLFILLLMVPVLFYIPAVQNFLQREVTSWLSRKTEMQISIGHIRLAFPLNLGVKDALILTAPDDTLLYCRTLEMDVALRPLFKKELQVKGVSLQQAVFHYADTVSAMDLSGHLDEFTLGGSPVNLKTQEAMLSDIALKGGTVRLKLGESVPDTAQKDTSSLHWVIAADKLQIENIGFFMETSPEATRLDVRLKTGRVTDCRVDLGRQQVRAESVMLRDGTYAYLTDTVSVASPNDTLKKEEAEKTPAEMWTIEVNKVRSDRNAFAYGRLTGEAAPGVDFNHLQVSDLNLKADSVYNRGMAIRARIREFSARERSGFVLEKMQAYFLMDTARIEVSDLEIKTENSSVGGTVEAAAGILKSDGSAPLSARLTATIGMQDVLYFYPELSKMPDRTLLTKKVAFSGDLSGTLNDLSVNTMRVDMAPYLRLSLSGVLQSVLAPKDMSGRLRFDGELKNTDFMLAFVPDTALRHRLALPEYMTVGGLLAARNGTFFPQLKVTADGGSLAVSGSFARTSEAYLIEMETDSFPVYRFLPHDSLGSLSLKLKAEGAGFDLFAATTRSDVEIRIGRLDYRGYAYRDIGLTAGLHQHEIKGEIVSGSEALRLHAAIEGHLAKEDYGVRMAGRLGNLDLEALHFATQKTSVSTAFTLQGSLSGKVYKADVLLDSTALALNGRDYRMERLTLDAFADDRKVTADLRTGDLRTDIRFASGLDTLLQRVNRFSTLLNAQLKNGSFDMEKLDRAMPPFYISASAAMQNIAYRFLSDRGILFRRFSLLTETEDNRPFTLAASLQRFTVAGIIMDTLSLDARQSGPRLNYEINLHEVPGNAYNIAYIGLNGFLEGNRLQLNCKQQDDAGKVGFDFGVNVSLADNTITLNLFPLTPVLAFERWKVNDNNRLSYRLDGALFADFQLTGASKSVTIQSAALPSGRKGAVRLDMKGIDIGASLSLFPTAPPITGYLSSDLVMTAVDKDFSVSGNLSVDELNYDKRRVGDIDLTLKYNPDSLNNQYVYADLAIDKKEALQIDGTYRPADQENSLDVTVNIPSFPLSPANVFMPPDMAELTGQLTGHVQIGGTPVHPAITGELRFLDAAARVDMISSTFKLGPDVIRLQNSKLVFNKYAITGANENPLSINGSIDFSNFQAILFDISVTASDFQVMNVPKSRKAMVYGKADIDLGASVKGTLDDLVVRGDVELLNGTDVTYVLQDSPTELKNETQDVVTFVSFKDTAQVLEDEENRSVKIGGIDLLANITIASGVQVAVNLSPDGKDRVNVQGGGNLTYTMNPLGDTRFLGRYVLSGGTVRYSPPLISQKVFNIQDGSYVQWNGEMMNPSFQITAVEALRTQVTEDDKTSRLVTFDISIHIDNDLENMEIRFDLAAPDDITIQNQLSSMTAEQRATQAMNLLIYNTYTGPGTVAKANLNSNPLNSFIQKELNQWARDNLKGIDLSFGIDTYDQYNNGVASQRTDYSYKLSKSLFNDRIKVIIGGSFSPDVDPNENLKENLVDDITLEYQLNKRDNMFLKVFRHTGYESILEGEVVQTGVGFVVRKKLLKLKNLFRFTRNKQTEVTR